METLIAREWRVSCYFRLVGSSAITQRAYASEASAQRAADRMNQHDTSLERSYSAIEVRVVTDQGTAP